MNIPNEEEYKAAKKIVDSYKENQEKILIEKVKDVQLDLDEFFKTTYIKKFILRPKFNFPGTNQVEIYSLDPEFDEDYEGDLDDGVEKIAKKHDLYINWGGGIYSK